MVSLFEDCVERLTEISPQYHSIPDYHLDGINHFYNMPANNIPETLPFNGCFYDKGYMLLDNEFIPMSLIRKVSFKKHQMIDDWLGRPPSFFWSVVIEYGSDRYDSGRYKTEEEAKKVAENIIKQALPFIQPNAYKLIKEI